MTNPWASDHKQLPQPGHSQLVGFAYFLNKQNPGDYCVAVASLITYNLQLGNMAIMELFQVLFSSFYEG